MYKTLVLSSLHAMALTTPRSARIIADGLTLATVASAVPLTILAPYDLVVLPTIARRFLSTTDKDRSKETG